MFTSLRVFHLGCGAIFVIYEKAYTKMAPQGATLRCKYAKHTLDNSVLTVPLKLSNVASLM